jgi:hypothetical protein
MDTIEELYQENSSTANKNSCLYVRLLVAFSTRLLSSSSLPACLSFHLFWRYCLFAHSAIRYCPPDMRSFGFSPSFFAHSVWVKNRERGRENILLFSSSFPVPDWPFFPIYPVPRAEIE